MHKGPETRFICAKPRFRMMDDSVVNLTMLLIIYVLVHSFLV
nr:hypothetical protein Iba_chr15bCG6690 [Ipomoea batatas]